MLPYVPNLTRFEKIYDKYKKYYKLAHCYHRPTNQWHLRKCARQFPRVDGGELVQNMKLTTRPPQPALQQLFSRFCAALCAASALLIQPCIACTGLSIQATDGGLVTGRTLEFGADPQSQIVVFPAGMEFVGTVPKGKGLKFKSLYGFAGANGFGVHDAIIDGLNEKGLYVGLFYFPGCAKYMEPTQDNNAKGLAPWEFGTWVLANFSTVDEVNAAIARIALVPTYLNTLKEVPAGALQDPGCQGSLHRGGAY